MMLAVKLLHYFIFMIVATRRTIGMHIVCFLSLNNKNILK